MDGQLAESTGVIRMVRVTKRGKSGESRATAVPPSVGHVGYSKVCVSRMVGWSWAAPRGGSQGVQAKRGRLTYTSSDGLDPSRQSTGKAPRLESRDIPRHSWHGSTTLLVTDTGIESGLGKVFPRTKGRRVGKVGPMKEEKRKAQDGGCCLYFAV
jgi:hypothetical protein